MTAVDTNILVYSHREDSMFFHKAYSVVKELAESGKDWAIPWPCIYEFLAIVTHPRIYNPPTPLTDAVIQVDCWIECPTLYLIGESGVDHWKNFSKLLESTHIRGAQVHDARIVSICLAHKVDSLWTADRDFSRFPQLNIENPLLKK
ncbi:MAG: VapC toxin family PIN domain ribonuclease [Spirochaetes bacterium]|nr:MAG: VapC toxin family PIN domain ribonuclease [Spirochaetota bacterium]